MNDLIIQFSTFDCMVAASHSFILNNIIDGEYANIIYVIRLYIEVTFCHQFYL